VLPDVEVQDQNGRKLKFYSELVKGRKVVINFIYTSCKAVCPMSGDHFAKLQKTLGDKLGRDVFLISVTTDPEVDSPDRLKTWSKRFNPSPGWTLVTGSRKEISSLLLVLTGDGTQTGYHVPAICLIDDLKKSHRWTYGLSDPAEIMRMII
jgi:protein SCO1